jgi:hypothetical protein
MDGQKAASRNNGGNAIRGGVDARNFTRDIGGRR